MSDDFSSDNEGLPRGLTDDIAALAAVMKEHGLEKIQVNANGVRVVLTGPQTAKGLRPTALTTAETEEDVEGPMPNGSANGFLIHAPMIGTYYSAPKPGEDPYVRVGDLVAAGQTVAVIEAMKIFNEIQAERSGIVDELLVSNGQPVEYNQPLMRLT